MKIVISDIPGSKDQVIENVKHFSLAYETGDRSLHLLRYSNIVFDTWAARILDNKVRQLTQEFVTNDQEFITGDEEESR